MKVKVFEDALKDMENGVYNFCQDGKCIGCGNCCSNVLPMSKAEVELIKNYIKKHKIKEQVSNVVSSGTIDMTCPFMSKDRTKDKCLIYKVRPEICRKFLCCNPPSSHAAEEIIKLQRNKNIYGMRSTFYGK